MSLILHSGRKHPSTYPSIAYDLADRVGIQVFIGDTNGAIHFDSVAFPKLLFGGSIKKLYCESFQFFMINSSSSFRKYHFCSKTVECKELLLLKTLGQKLVKFFGMHVYTN